jgi:hypothetical protein
MCSNGYFVHRFIARMVRGACAALVALLATQACRSSSHELLSGNHPPVVHSVTASPGTATPGVWVQLACTANDPEGGALSYTWSGGGEFESRHAASSRWRSNATGDFTLQCTAFDKKGLSAEGSVVAHIVSNPANLPPVITAFSANPDFVISGQPVQLRCTATDPENGPLTYLWSGPGAFVFASVPDTQWSQTVPGGYDLLCTVSDDAGNQTARGSHVVVTAQPNSPPVIASLTATPGTVSVGQTTTLSCTASDPDGDTLAYSWYGATGFQSPAAPQTQWSSAAAGEFTLGCTVDDGHGHSVAMEVPVTVQPPPNAPPQITQISALPSTVALGAPAALSCTASDPDGDQLIYNWAGAGTFGAPGSSSTAWQHDVPGGYTLTCAVDDGHGHVVSSPVQVTVQTPPDTAPPQWTGGTPGFSVTPYEGYVLCSFNGAADQDSPPVQYSIYYAPYVSGQPLDLATAQKVVYNSLPAMPIRIEGLALGVTYTFGVVATDSAPAPNSTAVATVNATPQVYFDTAPAGEVTFSNLAASGSFISRSDTQPILCVVWIDSSDGILYEAHATDGAWVTRQAQIDGVPPRHYTMARVIFFNGRPVVVAADDTGILDLLRQRIDAGWDGLQLFAGASGTHHTWLDITLDPNKPQLYIGHALQYTGPPNNESANFMALNLAAGGNPVIDSLVDHDVSPYIGQLHTRIDVQGKPALAYISGVYSLTDPAVVDTQLVLATYEQYTGALTSEVVTAVDNPLFVDLQPGLNGWELLAASATTLDLDGTPYLGTKLERLSQVGGAWLPPVQLDASAAVHTPPLPWRFNMPLECCLLPGTQWLNYVKGGISVTPPAPVSSCSTSLWSGPLVSPEPGASLAQFTERFIGSSRYILGVATADASLDTFASPTLFQPGALMLRQME